MSQNDKKIIWEVGNFTNAADTTFDKQEVTVFDNSSGQVNITLDSVDGEVSLVPFTGSKIYYCMLYITDPGGSVPTGLDGASDAQLATWINNNRKHIWMCNGGYAKYNAAIGDEEVKLVLLGAETKRTLVSGQKCILVALTRNTSATADTTAYLVDFSVFYHY